MVFTPRNEIHKLVRSELVRAAVFAQGVSSRVERIETKRNGLVDPAAPAYNLVRMQNVQAATAYGEVCPDMAEHAGLNTLRPPNSQTLDYQAGSISERRVRDHRPGQSPR